LSLEVDRRKHECSVQAELAHQRRPQHAGILGHVRDPERLARLQHRADQADAGREDDLAGFLDELFVLPVGSAPVLSEAQPAVLVAAPVLPALPALGLADRADHRSQRGAHVLGLAQAAAYLVLEREQLLLAPAMGDLPRDAAVSAETPFGVEKRVTARAEVA